MSEKTNADGEWFAQCYCGNRFGGVGAPHRCPECGWVPGTEAQG